MACTTPLDGPGSVVGGHRFAFNLQNGFMRGRGKARAARNIFQSAERSFGVGADVAERINRAVENIIGAGIAFQPLNQGWHSRTALRTDCAKGVRGACTHIGNRIAKRAR